MAEPSTSSGGSSQPTLLSLFTAIAGAIRAKKGTTEDIPAIEFPAYIRALTSGAELAPATVTINHIGGGSVNYFDIDTNKWVSQNISNGASETIKTATGSMLLISNAGGTLGMGSVGAASVPVRGTNSFGVTLKDSDDALCMITAPTATINAMGISEGFGPD